MSCCGRHDRQAAPLASGRAPGRRTGRGIPPLTYTGTTALTVLGPRSGRVYRFAEQGARLTVDPRDWSALVRLPTLQPA